MSKDPYQRIAKRYDRLFQSMNAGLFRLGLKLFPPTAHMSVLDIGFGTGSQLAHYQKAGCQVWGLDASPSMLKVAQAKLGHEAHLHLGDATKMPFTSQTFDLVTTTLVIHEMSPQIRQTVLSEMARVMKPNGRILIIDFHPGKLKIPQGWFTKVFITFSEFMAGRDHFKHYRDFMKHGGFPTLVAQQNLDTEITRIVSGGNMALFLLKSKLTDSRT